MIAEREDKNIIFTSFDAMQGRKAEVTRVPAHRSNWAISPDGSRLAYAEFSYTQGEVQIIPTHGGERQKVSAAPGPRSPTSLGLLTARACSLTASLPAEPQLCTST